MNFFTKPLKAVLPALAAVLLCPLLAAAPEYLLYNITAKTAKEVTPTGDTAEWLRKDIHRGVKQADGSTSMLFVRDPSLNVPGYIGVYEVLQTQAEALGWDKDVSGTVTPQAVYALDRTGIQPNADPDSPSRNQSLESFPALRYPTKDEWLAYLTDVPRYDRDALTPANMPDGGVRWGDLPKPTEWWTWQTQNSKYAKSFPNGPVDMFGNVAEYVSDSELYFGGTTTGVLTFGSITKDNAGQTVDNLFAGVNDNRGLLGARLMYIPPAEQRYTVTVTHNGYTFSENSYKAGATITVTAPTPQPEHRFSEWPKEHADPATPTFSYTVEAKDVRFNYTSKKYATLKVTGGTASETRPFLNTTVTLTAPAENDRGPFRTWIIAGEEIKDAPAAYVYTVPSFPGTDPLTPITIAAEAVYSRHPRVLVFGGKAEVIPDEAETGKAFGDGFYRSGTVLQLIPDTLTGFTFDCWEADPTSEERIGSTYTVGAADTVVKLSARFKPAEEGGDTPAAVPSVLGAEDPAAEKPTAALRFGYKFNDREDLRTVTDQAGNTFVFYEAKLFGGEAPTDAYARLAFGTNAVMDDKDKNKVNIPETPSSLSYLTGTVKDGKNSAFQSTDTSTSLLMKRVNWTGGNKDIACYYLGINELTVAQAEKLAERAGAKKTDLNFDNKTAQVSTYRTGINLTDALHRSEPFVFGAHGYGERLARSSLEDIDRLLAYLNGATFGKRHGMTFVLPRSTMIKEAVSAGAGADKDITKEMVVSDVQRGQRDGWWLYKKSASKQCDPSGFYDLWGNVSETLDNGSARILAGGSAINSFNYCNLNRPAETPAKSTDCGAFRPAVPVLAQRTVTVETYDGPQTVKVFPGQKLLLAPQKRSEQAFSGWTASIGKAPKLNGAGTHYEYTVTNDVTLTPDFTPVSAVSLTYDGCLGPALGYPGQTLTLYLADGETRELTDIEVTPAEALAAKDIASRTMTLNASEVPVTVKAVFREKPKPVVKPGFRFLLR